MRALLHALPGLTFASLVAAAPLPPAARPAAVAAAPASAAASAPAAPQPLVDACPAQLPVRQALTQDFPGWTSLNEQSNYPFARIALYPGPPAESTRLVPSSEYRNAAGLHDAWDLPRRPSGYWLACSYGNTTATVARKLPDGMDYCVADYDGRFMTLVVRRWTCGEKRLLGPRPVARPRPARPPVRRTP